MRWYIKTEKQKDNIAKFAYDLAKIILTITVISPIAKPDSINAVILGGGIAVTSIFFLLGNLLDSREVKS